MLYIHYQAKVGSMLNKIKHKAFNDNINQNGLTQDQLEVYK